MSQITARFPVIEVDGNLVTLAIGSAAAEFGEEVALHAAFDRKRYESLYIHGVDTVPANEVAPEVMRLFGITNHADFVDALSRAHGTGLPEHVPVTFYTLSSAPVESYDESAHTFTAEAISEPVEEPVTTPRRRKGA